MSPEGASLPLAAVWAGSPSLAGGAELGAALQLVATTPPLTVPYGINPDFLVGFVHWKGRLVALTSLGGPVGLTMPLATCLASNSLELAGPSARPSEGSLPACAELDTAANCRFLFAMSQSR